MLPKLRQNKPPVKKREDSIKGTYYSPEKRREMLIREFSNSILQRENLKKRIQSGHNNHQNINKFEILQ